MRLPFHPGKARALGLAALLLAAPALATEDGAKDSVVNVYTTVQTADYYEPWKPGAEYPIKGCGAILPGHRILTTAHLVDRGEFIQVQKFGKTRRYTAKVESVGLDLDLAVLSVEDGDFFEGTHPVALGELPARGDKLVLQGGDELSTKEDTVSGIGMVLASESNRFVPAVLTNAPVDPGNDGCPVLHNGRLVGIPFESTGKSDKSGSLIPVNVIQRFFQATAGGGIYMGLPDLGFYTQDLENPALRSYYKIPRSQTGEIVSKIFYGGSADGVLEEGDVLTAIDGHAVDDEGYINLDKVGRVPEVYLATFYPIGGKMTLDILRDGKPKKIEMPLKPAAQLLPLRNDVRHPTYFILGGLVFTPLTLNYFGTAGWDAFKPELQELFFHGLPSPKRRQVILISHVLPHAVNKGYDMLANMIVDKVNGRSISDMGDLLEAFQHPVGKYQEIGVDDFDFFGTTIVLNAEDARKATPEILETFRIKSDRSEDLK